MMVNAELYVKDLPGQLVGSLEPISLVDGNIVGVVHDRELKVNQRICVNVTFEVSRPKDLDKLKNIWKTRDVIVARMGSVFETFSMTYMLVGDFTATYVEDLLTDAGKIVKLESVDVGYSSKNSTATRTALISAELLSKEDLDKLDGFFASACAKDKLTYIRGL